MSQKETSVRDKSGLKGIKFGVGLNKQDLGGGKCDDSMSGKIIY